MATVVFRDPQNLAKQQARKFTPESPKTARWTKTKNNLPPTVHLRFTDILFKCTRVSGANCAPKWQDHSFSCNERHFALCFTPSWRDRKTNQLLSWVSPASLISEKPRHHSHQWQTSWDVNMCTSWGQCNSSCSAALAKQVLPMFISPHWPPSESRHRAGLKIRALSVSNT